MWNSTVLNYPCAKFYQEVTIDNGINLTFHVFCFVYFGQTTEDQYNDVSNFMQIFFHIWANTWMVQLCAKFHYDRSTNNEDTDGGGGGGACRPLWPKDVKKPSPIRVKPDSHMS